jgi:hypothetical protein
MTRQNRLRQGYEPAIFVEQAEQLFMNGYFIQNLVLVYI